VALTNFLASPFGYAALVHISFPTLLLGKSTKLVPVMLMKIVLYRTRYPAYKYITVALITVGVSAFMLLQPMKADKSNTSSLWGILLLSVNLLMDGATNSTQDQIFHKFKGINGQHMMLFMNLFASIYTVLFFATPFAYGELGNAVRFLMEFPQALIDVLIFAMSGGIGQCFIFYALEKYGSMSLVTVTVTRKMFSIILSVLWFGHSLAIGQWMGVAMVFSGIGIDTEMRKREKKKEKAEVMVAVDTPAIPLHVNGKHKQQIQHQKQGSITSNNKKHV